MPKKIIALLILLISHIHALAGADEMAQMEKVISEYYAYKANCPVNAKVNTEILMLAVNSHLDTLRLNPTLLYSDRLLKVRIEVCNIKAHQYVWMRKTDNGYYRITHLGQVSRIDQIYSMRLGSNKNS